MSNIIDNFKLIEPLLVFRDGDDTFYHRQIIQRKKDTGSVIKKNYHLIRSYFIQSVDKLRKREEQIKGLCDFFNARAYINLNPKSFRLYPGIDVHKNNPTLLYYKSKEEEQ